MQNKRKPNNTVPLSVKDAKAVALAMSISEELLFKVSVLDNKVGTRRVFSFKSA